MCELVVMVRLPYIQIYTLTDDMTNKMPMFPKLKALQADIQTMVLKHI